MGMSLYPRKNTMVYLLLVLNEFRQASCASPTALTVDTKDSPAFDGTACNITLYHQWYNRPYSGAFLDELIDLWLFSDAELRNGQALEVMSSTCKEIMDTLRLDRAGRNGPAADKYIYDVMCANECILSDSLREEAMSITGCTCLQLSTQPSEVVYHTPGDWCSENSGRILCDTLGQCGRWKCHISDFMCPRYEYNKHFVPYRGKGDCSGIERSTQPLLVAIISAVVLQAMWLCLLSWSIVDIGGNRKAGKALAPLIITPMNRIFRQKKRRSCKEGN